MKFSYIIVSNGRILKSKNERQNIFITDINPQDERFNKYIRKVYKLDVISKEIVSNIFVIHVLSFENTKVKTITCSAFINNNKSNITLKELCDFLKLQNKESGVKLQYGLLEDGHVIGIWDVPQEKKGLKCGCVYPACGERLQAKLGTGKKQPHFSHNNADCDIDVAHQTAIHIMAKQVIATEMQMKLPFIRIAFKDTDIYKKLSYYERQKYELDNTWRYIFRPCRAFILIC